MSKKQMTLPFCQKKTSSRPFFLLLNCHFSSKEVMLHDGRDDKTGLPEEFKQGCFGTSIRCLPNHKSVISGNPSQYDRYDDSIDAAYAIKPGDLCWIFSTDTEASLIHSPGGRYGFNAFNGMAVNTPVSVLGIFDEGYHPGISTADEIRVDIGGIRSLRLPSKSCEILQDQYIIARPPIKNSNEVTSEQNPSGKVEACFYGVDASYFQPSTTLLSKQGESLLKSWPNDSFYTLEKIQRQITQTKLKTLYHERKNLLGQPVNSDFLLFVNLILSRSDEIQQYSIDQRIKRLVTLFKADMHCLLQLVHGNLNNYCNATKVVVLYYFALPDIFAAIAENNLLPGIQAKCLSAHLFFVTAQVLLEMTLIPTNIRRPHVVGRALRDGVPGTTIPVWLNPR